jgi:hypothetical protein
MHQQPVEGPLGAEVVGAGGVGHGCRVGDAVGAEEEEGILEEK